MSESGEVFGKELGDFRILREIGRGGMGTVYLAEQVSLRRTVALKVLNPGVALNPNVIKRFHREAEAAGRLHHPYIVQVFAVGEEGGTHFFAMEYVEGESLDQIARRLRKGAKIQDLSTHPSSWSAEEEPALEAEPAAEEEPREGESADSTASETQEYILGAARLMAEVADALDYAHRHGIIHRDVKPHNILVDRGGRPYLVDFGLAQAEGTMGITKTGEVFGTPTYMSPEQVAGSLAKIDHRTDIYSLGCSFYELLTLRRPFEGKTPQETVRKILTTDPRDPRRWNRAVPRDLATILLKCMEKDPDKRYRTAAELQADLKRFLAGDPILARPIGFFERGWRFVGRRRGASTAAAVIVLLVGVAAYLGTKTRTASLGMKGAEAARLAGEAEAALQAGEVQEAERKIEEGLEKDPEQPRLHFLRGRILRGQGRVDDAWIAFDKAWRLDPQDPAPRLEAADMLAARREFRRAAELYREVLALQESRDDVHDKLGDCLRELGERDPANQEYEKAEKIRLDRAMPLVEQARALLREARDLGPPGSEACRPKLAEAERKLQAALKQYPKLPEAHLVLGEASLQGGNPARAFGAAEFAVQGKSRDPEGFFLRAECRLHLGGLDAALADYEQASRLAETKSMGELAGRCHLRLAQIAFSKGDWESAVRDAQAALRADSTNRDARLLHGLILSELGRVEEAERVFQGLISSGGSVSASARLGLALLWERRGLWEKALAELAAAERADPKDPRVLFHRARIGIGHDRKDPGDVESIDRALALDPENPGAYLLRFRARLLERGSEADFFEALELDPEFAAENFFKAYRGDLGGLAFLASPAPPLPRISSKVESEAEEEDSGFLPPAWRETGEAGPGFCQREQIDRWIQELGSPAPRVREIAEQDLARCGWQAIRALRAALDGPVEPEARLLLDRLEERQRAAQKRVVYRWLSDGGPGTAGYRRIVDLGIEVLPSLVDVLDKDLDRRRKRWAFKSVVEIGKPEAAAALGDLVESDNPTVRFFALRALTALAQPPKPEKLRELFRDKENASVRLAVLFAAASGESGNPALRDLLQEALQDPMALLRWMAARLIGEGQQRSLMLALRRAMMTETDPDVRERMFRSLIDVGDDGAVSWMGTRKVWGGAGLRPQAQTETLFQSLSRSRTRRPAQEGGEGLAEKILEEGPPLARVHLLQSWDVKLCVRHLAALFKMKESADPVDRVAALWALRRLGVESGEELTGRAEGASLAAAVARSLLSEKAPADQWVAESGTILRKLKEIGRLPEAERFAAELERRRLRPSGQTDGKSGADGGGG